MRTNEALTRLEKEFLTDKEGKEINSPNDFNERRFRYKGRGILRRSQLRGPGTPSNITKGVHGDGALGSNH